VRHGHVQVNGKKVDIPSFRVSENDIVEVAAKSRELTPFIIARAEAGERPVPAWIEVIPDKMRILVHTLPLPAQVDTLVQEQAIAEYSSKHRQGGGRPWRARPARAVGSAGGQHRGCHIAGSAERNSNAHCPAS